jgi:putative DNA primase/helicase
MCGGTDRFRFDDKEGTGSYYCGGCGAGYGIDLVTKFTGMDFKDAAKAIDAIIGKVSAEPAKKEKSDDAIRAELRRVLSESDRNDSTGYLRSRGISSVPDVVFHQELDYWQDGKVTKHPAMIGVVRDVHGKGIAIHRTYLKQGGKADVESPRKMSSVIGQLQGGAIRLYPAKDVLGVAEGIETACSAHEIFGIPVWSCISANLLEAFVVPEGIKKLVVLADNDSTFTGQKAAYVLAHRVSLKGLSVEVKIPKAKDWNEEARSALVQA